MSLLRIGDLARLGGVSVRMLRHYHELGLLEPTSIDGTTGYRLYETTQLEELRRIVMLKNLGLSLGQVGEVVHGRPSNEALRQVLLERRAAVTNEIETSRTNLAELDRHLTTLDESEHPMTGTPRQIEVELKTVPARLVAQLSAVAESWAPEHIGPVIQPLYPELMARMEAAGVSVAGPSTAWYADTADGRVQVNATLTIGEPPAADAAALGFDVVELPAIEMAATTIHRGSMDNCDVTYLAMIEWLDRNGHQTVGYSRELDIECGPDQEWVTELQFELAT